MLNFLQTLLIHLNVSNLVFVCIRLGRIRNESHLGKRHQGSLQEVGKTRVEILEYFSVIKILC